MHGTPSLWGTLPHAFCTHSQLVTAEVASEQIIHWAWTGAVPSSGSPPGPIRKLILALLINSRWPLFGGGGGLEHMSEPRWEEPGEAFWIQGAAQ